MKLSYGYEEITQKLFRAIVQGCLADEYKSMGVVAVYHAGTLQCFV